MCVVDNTCLQAFGFIPLVSGDVDSPDDDGMVLFRDTTTVANNVRLVERAMRGRRATGLRNLTSYRTDEQILIFLLKRTTLRSSAELVQEPLQ